MAKEGITPEEKLLKIIENPDDHKDSYRGAVQEVKDGSLAKKGQALFKNILSGKQFSFKFTLHSLNRIFIFLAAFLTLFLIFDFTKDRVSSKKKFALITKPPIASEKEELQESLPSVNLSASIKVAKKKNIFDLAPAKAEPVTKKKVEKDKASNLKLVGILWSRNPQAMIENSQDKQTYILNAGDKVARWKVKKIYNDKVVLMGSDGELELR